ncbi:MAG: EMC3/TMCO1 family protein [Promethearchaeota archaeon]
MSIIVVMIQIMFITLGMIVLGMALNYILGLRKDVLKEMRKNALNIRERMKNAQIMGDYQLMSQLQKESVQFMKIMMKKQMIPMCLRCLVFIGIFIVLGFIYSDYESGLLPFPLLFFGSGWLAIYLIFSLYFSLVIWGVKRLTGMGRKTQSSVREIAGIVSPTQPGSGFPISKVSTQDRLKKIDILPRKDAWKDRIEE